MKKKIRLFLAAYVNFPNAQNINCDNIARYINKDKFEVHVMYTNKMPIDKAYYRSKGVHLHKLIHHRFIWYWSKLLSMLVTNCDIYYLPKGEKPDKTLVRLLKGKRRLITSIEGVITEKTNNTYEFRSYYESMDSFFAISRCIASSVEEFWGDQVSVLPLGVTEIKAEEIKRDKIEHVIWVGNIKANKRPLWLIEIAREFPQLTFIMIGDGDMQNEVDAKIEGYGLGNVTRTGRIPNEKVYQYLMQSDLLLMTSEYEGLPKVIQEAAQCGVPSIYVNQNYNVDFIEDGGNGYGVADIDEMKQKLRLLLNYPERYREMARKAKESIKPYLWPVLIKQYEDYFESLVTK